MADVADEISDDEAYAAADSGSAAAASADDPATKPITGLLIAYTVGRLGVFVVLVVLFYLIGFQGLPGFLAAAIVSIPLSFVLLKTWRVELAQRIEQRKIAQLSMKDAFRSTGRD